MSERAKLIDLVNQLTTDELKIALIYVESLHKTRPIRQAPKENRAHMAVFELENNPI